MPHPPGVGPGAEISRANGRKNRGGYRMSGERLELRELCKREMPHSFARILELAKHGQADEAQC